MPGPGWDDDDPTHGDGFDLATPSRPVTTAEVAAYERGYQAAALRHERIGEERVIHAFRTALLAGGTFPWDVDELEARLRRWGGIGERALLPPPS